MMLFLRKPREDDAADRLIQIFQSETAEIDATRVPRRLRTTLIVMAAMLVSLVVLAALFDVDRVVTSDFGQIVTIDPTIVIQPLDASIIKTIAVQEGQRVKAGDLLGELDPTFVAADVETLALQISSLDAEIARCEAELAGKPFNYVPGDGPGAAKYAALQTAYYVQRKAQYDSQIHAYDEQIAQATATLVRLTHDSARYGDREKLNAELERIRIELVEKQLDSRVNLLEASDQKTELLRDIELDQNEVIETQHQLEATKAGRDAFVQQWLASTSQEMVGARNNDDSAKQQLEKANKHQDLVRLMAPVDAIVLRIAKLSVGSVLQPSETFIELASLSSPIEAEINIDPQYVGFVRPGDETIIKLDPYNYVEHGWADGKLRWVSEGTFIVENQSTGGASATPSTSPEADTGSATSSSGQTSSMAPRSFYKARLTIDKVALHDVPDDFRLVPGMTLTADIHVGTRSLLWFLIRGIVRGFDESMREP